MEIFLSILFIIGLIMLFIGLITEKFPVFLAGVILMAISAFIGVFIIYESNIKLNKINFTYKVRELERNTVFNITDTVNSLEVNDTIWVDVKNKKVNPLDTTVMLCVVVKEIK